MLRIVLIVYCSILTGCVTPDPLFLQNAAKVQDVEYSPNKVVGVWTQMYVSPVQSKTFALERKLYFDLAPGGRGRMREVVMNRSTGGKLVGEQSISWKYSGLNRWKVNIPPSSGMEVTEKRNINLEFSRSDPGALVEYRYYGGNLYDFKNRIVLVPADGKNVSQLADRMRRATPKIEL